MEVCTAWLRLGFLGSQRLRTTALGCVDFQPQQAQGTGETRGRSGSSAAPAANMLPGWHGPQSSYIPTASRHPLSPRSPPEDELASHPIVERMIHVQSAACVVASAVLSCAPDGMARLKWPCRSRRVARARLAGSPSPACKSFRSIARCALVKRARTVQSIENSCRLGTAIQQAGHGNSTRAASPFSPSPSIRRARISVRTVAQAAVWTWIILSIGWLAMVAWVAIIEPMDDATPWVYTMTAVVPPGSILAVGAALTLTARAFLRCLSLLRLEINKNLGGCRSRCERNPSRGRAVRRSMVIGRRSSGSSSPFHCRSSSIKLAYLR